MVKKNEGVVISGGDIRAGHFAVGPGASVYATHVGGGSNVNIGSRLTSTKQTGYAVVGAGGGKEQDLATLLEALTEALKTAPANKSEQAEALVSQAAQLIEIAGNDHPNRTMLQVISSGLKQTAEFLKEAVPAAVKLTGQILDVISKLHGLSV
jgi:hypothetical protein